MVQRLVGPAKRAEFPFWRWESRIGHNLLVLWTAQAHATTTLVGQAFRLPVRTTRLAWTNLGLLPGRDSPDETVRDDGAGSDADQVGLETDQVGLEADQVGLETDHTGAGPVDADHEGADDGEVAVTFRLPASVDAHTAQLSGEFNEWSTAADTMNRRDDGSFELTKVLPAGRRWRFRYLLDGSRWENDWRADDYTANELGDYDSVIDLQAPSASRLVAGKQVVHQ